MALNIKSDETDHLARQLAKLTGENLTQAVTIALRERLERETRVRRLTPKSTLQKEVREIRERARQIRRKSDVSTDELLDYDEDGLWK